MSIFDSKAEEFGFWKWTTSSHRYGEALNFLPQNVRRAIDVGCGAGQLGMRLTEHVPYVVGVDLSPNLIAIAKRYQIKLKRDNIDFLVGRLESLPFPQNMFDFVVCYHILHFVPAEQALLYLRGLLKPGGRMVVSEIWHPEPSKVTFADQAFRALRVAPSQIKLYGLRSTWRIMRFQTSREWINQIRKYDFLTPEEFKNICSRLLPGCRFERLGWESVAFWQSPRDSKQVN